MPLPPTFTEKHKLKSVSKERKCRSEDNYNYNYEFNRSETNEFKTIAYRLKQNRKGYIGNLTKCRNRAISLLEIPHNTREVALMKEKLEFAVFNLERITDEYSQYVTLQDQAAAHHLYIEHKTRADIVITKCLEYVEQDETSTEASSEALDGFFDNSSYYSKESKPITRLPSQNSRNTHKSINVKPLKSRNINTKFDVEVPVLPETAALKSQRRLQILKKQIELEEAQAFDTVSEAKKKVIIAELLENLRDTPPINTRIKKPSNILPPSERRLKKAIQPSSSHPSSIHPTKIFTERDTVIRRKLIPYKAKKAKSTSANESPERSSVSQKTQISNPNHDIPQSIEHFIDLLVEGQETKLDIRRKEATGTSLLQMELESTYTF